MYSKGLKTVSVAMTQVLPVASVDSAAASLEAASEEASEVASDGAALEAAEIRVPLFINEGEHIRIDTRTGEYRERV